MTPRGLLIAAFGLMAASAGALATGIDQSNAENSGLGSDAE